MICFLLRLDTGLAHRRVEADSFYLGQEKKRGQGEKKRERERERESKHKPEKWVSLLDSHGGGEIKKTAWVYLALSVGR